LTLLFKRHYVQQIMSGEKTATRRKSRPKVKADGVYRIRTSFFECLPDRIRVHRLYQQRLGDMTPEDARLEGYASLKDFRRVWNDFYDSWDDEQTVWVVEFEYLGPPPLRAS